MGPILEGMATIKIDQTPASCAMILKRGDDMTPVVVTFQALNLTGYTVTADILKADGTVQKALTVVMVPDVDSVATLSGLTAAESTALPTSGLTWRLRWTTPGAKLRTLIEGKVTV